MITVPTETTLITKLGTMTAQSDQGASKFPIPVKDQFFPTELRARQFERDNDHRMFQTPAVVTSTDAQFTISFRARFSPVGSAGTGILISQFISDSPTFTGGFTVGFLNPTKLDVDIFDTSTTNTDDNLTSRSNTLLDIPGFEREDWHEYTIIVDGISTGNQTITILIDGVDVADTTGYEFQNTVNGNGVTTFAGTPDEFTVGNYDQNSGINNSPDYEIAYVQIWDDILLTVDEVGQNYQNKQTLVLALTEFTTDELIEVDQWLEGNPVMENGLTKSFRPFDNFINNGEYVGKDFIAASTRMPMAALDSFEIPMVNALVGDAVVAYIVTPNTGGSVATVLEAVATEKTITITPDVTPSNADGELNIILFRIQ